MFITVRFGKCEFYTHTDYRFFRTVLYSEYSFTEPIITSCERFSDCDRLTIYLYRDDLKSVNVRGHARASYNLHRSQVKWWPFNCPLFQLCRYHTTSAEDHA